MRTFELKKDQTIVFDGDSLTCLRIGPTLDQWPWLRISASHRSWSDVFSELLFAWRPDLNLTFRTAAVGGSCCLDLQERFKETIEAIKPDWVFMTLGSNDATRGIPVEDFESILRKYATDLGQWSGRLVFVYGIRACPNANESSKNKEKIRQPYYRVEEKLADELDNVCTLDAGKGLLEKSELLYSQYEGHNVYSDGNHFSHLGAMIIAGEVLKACGVVV